MSISGRFGFCNNESAEIVAEPTGFVDRAICEMTSMREFERELFGR
jgi:hypothetical protein